MVSALDQARRALVTLLRTMAAPLQNPRAVFGPLSEKLTHRRSENLWDFCVIQNEAATILGMPQLRRQMATTSKVSGPISSLDSTVFVL